jgi:hypothetical protein
MIIFLFDSISKTKEKPRGDFSPRSLPKLKR